IVKDFGTVIGDIAWGGNWFFLVDDPPIRLDLDNVVQLTEFAWAVRNALCEEGITGAQGKEIDHIELSCSSQTPGADSRNFVLCPGKAYDRSPCGTGTSAKLACLAADGKLAEGATWAQESIIGSTFFGSYRWVDRERGHIAPTIIGRAHVNAEGTLLIEESDPYCWGIR